jgi:hypothetical protein
LVKEAAAGGRNCNFRYGRLAGVSAGKQIPRAQRSGAFGDGGAGPATCYVCAMIDALIRTIEQKKAQLDRLRPLSAAALAQLQLHYDVELTYSSNAIEGNTLTLRETAEVIEHDITVGGKSLRDHLEAVDHYDAVLWMRELAGAATPIGEDVGVFIGKPLHTFPNAL